MQKKSFSYNLSVSVFKEGKKFVAYSPALDLSTSGKTFSEVKARFQEAVGIFFEEISKKGTAIEALSELGWKKDKSVFEPPVFVAHEIEKFNISCPV